MMKLFYILALLVGCILIGSCGTFYRLTGIEAPQEVVTTERNPQGMLNFSQGRRYAAQGRYELAREQYLMAYVAAEEDAVIRDAAAHEIQAMDLMIKTQR